MFANLDISIAAAQLGYRPNATSPPTYIMLQQFLADREHEEKPARGIAQPKRKSRGELPSTRNFKNQQFKGPKSKPSRAPHRK